METDNKLVKKWLKEADEDFDFALFALKEGDRFYSKICFHLQQAAEKYLKAFIVAQKLEFRKIHDLPALLNECKKKDLSFSCLEEACVFLNDFYIQVGYPAFYLGGESREEAEEAKTYAKKIRDFVKKRIQNPNSAGSTKKGRR